MGTRHTGMRPIRRARIAAILLLMLLVAGGPELAEPFAPKAEPVLALPQEDFPALPTPKPAPPGRFLIATRQVQGPFFAKSVVLLIQHDRNGAMGLILNRPSITPVSELLAQQEQEKNPKPKSPAPKEEPPRKDTIYVGGPVDPSRVVFLVQATKPPTDSIQVLPHVYATSESEVLDQFADNRLPPDHFRAYVGYAGWGPGQLEGEIARGDWFLAPAQTEAIFDPEPQKIWERLVAEHEGVQVHLMNKREERVSRFQPPLQPDS